MTYRKLRLTYRGVKWPQYARRVELREQDVDPDPLQQLRRWLDEAPEERVALATATKDGAPSLRMVLLKGADERGLRFFTSYESRKGRELAENPRAALLVHWPDAGRQVRVEGQVERVSAEESDAYWTTRPPGSRVSAAASPQSAVVAGREQLDELVAGMRERHGDKYRQMPTVDTVMCRAPMPNPSGPLSTLKATFTPGQLSSGSPMPMKTMLVRLSSGVRRRISRTCPAISNGVRFRRYPIRPVAQKTQRSAHPACDEMHRVRRPPLGISTDSMASPSASRQRYFLVPSTDCWITSSLSRGRG